MKNRLFKAQSGGQKFGGDKNGEMESNRRKKTGFPGKGVQPGLGESLNQSRQRNNKASSVLERSL